MKRCLIPFALALLVPFSAQGSENKWTYADLETAYKNGLCDAPPLEGQDRRLAALILLEDVLFAVTGNGSLTGDLVDDMSIFKIGRNPDKTLVALYEYADRKDVADVAYEDANKIRQTNQETKENEELYNKIYRPLFCSIYLMLEGKDFELKSELDSYFQSLNRKVRNRNMEKLERLTRDYN